MKRRRYQFQQVSAAAGQPQAITPQPVENPSPFMAAAGVSGSIALVGGMFSVAYSIDFSHVLTVATLPWILYGLGKSIYLIVLLVSDVTMLFEPSEPGQKKSTLLPIAKEDYYEMS